MSHECILWELLEEQAAVDASTLCSSGDYDGSA